MDLINDKYLLLDTNIVIDSLKYPEAFQPMYLDLDKRKVQAVLDHTVKFEFTRGATNLSLIKMYEEFLSRRYGSSKLELVINDFIYSTAITIAIIHGRNACSRIGFADCLIAAQMHKFEKNLFLATQDHQDFPGFLFKRVGVYTIDIQDKDPKKDAIKTVGIYQFNIDSYKEQVKRITSS